MRQLILNIAPEVADILGSEEVILNVFDLAELGFRCTACGQPGQLTPTDRASVVVYRPDGGTGKPIVRFAHEQCQASEVIDTDAPTGDNPGTIWPAHALLRPEGAEPRAVVLIGPRFAALRVTDGGETINRVLAELLGGGFAMLTHPDAGMPEVAGLGVYLFPFGGVAVVDGDDCPLWDGTLDLPPGWTDAITTTGHVGVIVASGLNLNDPGRDHPADLSASIRNGAAVAGRAELLRPDD